MENCRNPLISDLPDHRSENHLMNKRKSEYASAENTTKYDILYWFLFVRRRNEEKTEGRRIGIENE